MGIQRNTARPFARIISLSDSSGKSSVAPTRWRRLFATKGVVSYCFMRSFAVCTSTNSACPLHQSSNQAPRFYTILDILPNSKKKERPPNGVKDENVFDIQQGVA